ncbi:fish-egg lectin-like [Candoia aspera]|uniref:fish-egg lectin-like n=1 Tax=Candoia aspera TaxID=51853 RepID=UPI002FD7BEAA
MVMKEILIFLANVVLLKAQVCTEIPNPGTLEQIHAGNGLVVGLEPTGNVFMMNGEDWLYLAGGMKHVTSGVGGIWMVDNNDQIYRMIGGNLERIPGSFNQINAGGAFYVVGINSEGQASCISSSQLNTMKAGSPLTWTNMEGSLGSITCGLNGCWGVSSDSDVHYRHGVKPERCEGTTWEHIPGIYSMIATGSDGSVFALKSGNTYRRDGITTDKVTGSRWARVNGITEKAKRLTYDLNILWLITIDDKILRCQL